jgi:hypothetical protein
MQRKNLDPVHGSQGIEDVLDDGGRRFHICGRRPQMGEPSKVSQAELGDQDHSLRQYFFGF